MNMGNSGFECEDQPDGSRICKRYKIKRKGVYSTGTDVDLSAEPQTCRIMEKGRVNDEDRGAVDKEKKEMESRCKKGF